MSRPARVDLAVRDGAAVLTLDHPPANAWTGGMLADLERSLADIEAREAIRCVILTGAGGRIFSAGADLRHFRDASPDAASATIDAFHSAFDRLASFPGVTIAAIDGPALGGGLECALACDFRIAGDGARLGLPEVRVGLLPGGGGTQRLPALVGQAWARRLVLFGDQIDAVTARAIGLVDEVVPTGSALPTALRWSEKLAASSPSAVSACKRLLDGTRFPDGRDGFAAERREFAALFAGPDRAEGIASFFGKRPPVWTHGR